MFDHRALALGLADFSPFSTPPNRPIRSERKTDGGRPATSLLETIRDEIATATQDPSVYRMPRISNYPF